MIRYFVHEKQQLSADQRRRNEVEGCFGSGKRKYSLDLIMARLPKGAEALISMAFVVMPLMARLSMSLTRQPESS